MATRVAGTPREQAGESDEFDSFKYWRSFQELQLDPAFEAAIAAAAQQAKKDVAPVQHVLTTTASFEPPATARTRADDPAPKPTAVEAATVPAVVRQSPAALTATPWLQTLEPTRPDATASENRAFNDFYYWRAPDADIDIRALLREANGL